MKSIILLSLLAGLTASAPHLTLVPPPPAPVSCKMSNGKDRPYPCEFRIVAMYIMGKNNEVLGKITPGSTTQIKPLTLLKSKADSSAGNANSGALYYTVSFDFVRINTPSFTGPTLPGNPFLYTINTGTVDSPSTPSELGTLQKLAISPKLPPPLVRPIRRSFRLVLVYGGGDFPTLVAPIKYIHIANPITFNKVQSPNNKLSDRAEAAMPFFLSVDFKK